MSGVDVLFPRDRRVDTKNDRPGLRNIKSVWLNGKKTEGAFYITGNRETKSSAPKVVHRRGAAGAKRSRSAANSRESRNPGSQYLNRSASRIWTNGQYCGPGLPSRGLHGNMRCRRLVLGASPVARCWLVAGVARC